MKKDGKLEYRGPSQREGVSELGDTEQLVEWDT